jgi:PAS domain-containing protein
VARPRRSSDLAALRVAQKRSISLDQCDGIGQIRVVEGTVEIILLRTKIDTISALAACCFTDGTAEFRNRRWLEYTGLSHEEATCWGWQGPFHPEDLERLPQLNSLRRISNQNVRRQRGRQGLHEQVSALRTDF